MKKIFILLYMIAIVFSVSIASAIDQTEAVVKVFTTVNSLDYYMPWQSTGVNLAVGSGCIIAGNKILTNAHVVNDATFVQIKKNSNPKKYTARILSVGYDCDLALLTVDDPEFFKGIDPVELGELPKMQESVVVMGYPQGGDKISITEGVVSRIEVTPYSQSSRSLLTVQIDAAINPGNSGGPVLQNGKLVGVVMQALMTGQNIGYMIPPPIIHHFLNDFNDGHYEGFPVMGLDFNSTENDALRDFYHISKFKGGVVVTRVLPFSSADGIIKENDVILEVDGTSIGEDGTFPFRGNERIALSYLITQKQKGQNVRIRIVRDGKVLDTVVLLKEFEPMIPRSRYFDKPPYYIYGGLVFMVVSMDLMESWGPRWWERSPVDFNYYLIGSGRLNKENRKELVVLLNVLADDINVGYHEYTTEIINRVNGKEVKSFKEFVSILNEIKVKEPFTIFETPGNVKMILDNKNIDLITNQILKRNNIPSQYSDDVRGWVEKK